MRHRKRDTFTTIKTEGNLLPIDLLHRIAEGDSGLKGLTPDSYHLTRDEWRGEPRRNSSERRRVGFGAIPLDTPPCGRAFTLDGSYELRIVNSES